MVFQVIPLTCRKGVLTPSTNTRFFLLSAAFDVDRALAAATRERAGLTRAPRDNILEVRTLKGLDENKKDTSFVKSIGHFDLKGCQQNQGDVWSEN